MHEPTRRPLRHRLRARAGRSARRSRSPAARSRPPYQRAERADVAGLQGGARAAGAIWLPAAPADALDRGAWWTLFGDPELDRLAAQVEVSNQNVAAAVAAYAQAQALVREQRAGAASRRSASASSAQRSGGGSGVERLRGTRASQAGARRRAGSPTCGAARAAASMPPARARRRARPTSRRRASRRRASWRSTTSRCARPTPRSRCCAAPSKATSARCRSRRTATPPASSPRPTCCRRRRSSPTTRASLAALRGQRARFEHAIAVLVGKAPGRLRASRRRPWRDGRAGDPARRAVGCCCSAGPTSPRPSARSRRPTRRSASSAPAYFPSLTLSGSLGSAGSRVGDLFSASGALWSLGVSVAQTLFDAGATRARVDGARPRATPPSRATGRPCWRRSRRVEDQLVDAARAGRAGRLLRARPRLPPTDRAADPQPLPRRPARLHRRRHRPGLGAERAARAAAARASAGRSAAVALIQALGGGWDARRRSS